MIDCLGSNLTNSSRIHQLDDDIATCLDDIPARSDMVDIHSNTVYLWKLMRDHRIRDGQSIDRSGKAISVSHGNNYTTRSKPHLWDPGRSLRFPVNTRLAQKQLLLHRAIHVRSRGYYYPLQVLLLKWNWEETLKLESERVIHEMQYYVITRLANSCSVNLKLSGQKTLPDIRSRDIEG